MTTPEMPELYGPNAGPEGSEQREVYTHLLQAVVQAQHDNAATIQRLAQSGVAGADLIAQMTRITCLVDALFGTLDGHPGVVSMGNTRFRLELEQLTQRRIAETLADVQQMVQNAQQASGQTHQRQSGLIVAGRNERVNGKAL